MADPIKQWHEWYEANEKLEAARKGVEALFARPTREHLEAQLAVKIEEREVLLATARGASEAEIAPLRERAAQAQNVVRMRELATESLYLRTKVADKTLSGDVRRDLGRRLTSILAELAASKGALDLSVLGIDDDLLRQYAGGAG